MIDDIEDNYPEYLADERGYAWDAWDVLPANVIRRHDGIVEAAVADLDELDPAGLDDLDRWAFARASRRAGNEERYFDATRLILASKEEHRGIDYADVFVDAIEAFADAGLGDEALLHLGTFRERWSDDARAARLTVYVGARSGTLDASLSEAMNEAADDAELLYEIAEDLSRIHASAARSVLDAVSSLTESHGLASLELDVELLRASLPAETTE